MEGIKEKLKKSLRGAIYFLIFCPVLVINCTNRPSDAKLEATKDNILSNDTALLRTSADILYRSGDYARALSEYSQLIRLDSSKGKYYFRKASCLLELDSVMQACIYYNKAADLKYKAAKCYFVIGAIHLEKTSDSAAGVFLEKALSVDPNMEEARSLLFIIQKKRAKVLSL